MQEIFYIDTVNSIKFVPFLHKEILTIYHHAPDFPNIRILFYFMNLGVKVQKNLSQELSFLEDMEHKYHIERINKVNLLIL